MNTTNNILDFNTFMEMYDIADKIQSQAVKQSIKLFGYDVFSEFSHIVEPTPAIVQCMRIHAMHLNNKPMTQHDKKLLVLYDKCIAPFLEGVD